MMIGLCIHEDGFYIQKMSELAAGTGKTG